MASDEKQISNLSKKKMKQSLWASPLNWFCFVFVGPYEINDSESDGTFN